MRYCGIDVSDVSSRIHVIDEAGKKVEEAVMMNDVDSIRRFFTGRECMTVGLESSSISAWLAEEVGRYGHDVRVMDPRSVEALTKGKKTDKVDARMLARVLRMGLYREVYKKSREARLIRCMVVARANLVEVETRMSLTIQSITKHWGIRVGSSRKAVFFDRIEAGLKRMPELKEIINPLVNGLVGIREQIKGLDSLMAKASRRNANSKLLMSAPGVGPVVAMAYLAAIDDAKRFNRSKKVGSYLGLAARVNQSGESCRYGRITKQGDAVVRGYLLMAANSILTKCGRVTRLKSWGLGLVKKKGYAKAKVAVARKLSVIMHRMLLDGKTFDYALA